MDRSELIYDWNVAGDDVDRGAADAVDIVVGGDGKILVVALANQVRRAVNGDAALGDHAFGLAARIDELAGRE